MDLEIILQLITKNFFGVICHQDPSVLMKINGKDILLCPRCIGLHLGFLYTFLIITLYISKQIKIQGKFSIFIITMAIGLMIIDWSLGQLGLFVPTNSTQFVTGIVCGTSLAILAITYYREITHVSNSLTLNLSGIHIIGFICFSLCSGVLTIIFSNWIVLSLIIILCVAVNAILAIYIITIKVSRLFRINILN